MSERTVCHLAFHFPAGAFKALVELCRSLNYFVKEASHRACELHVYSPTNIRGTQTDVIFLLFLNQGNQRRIKAKSDYH